MVSKTQVLNSRKLIESWDVWLSDNHSNKKLFQESKLIDQNLNDVRSLFRAINTYLVSWTMWNLFNNQVVRITKKTSSHINTTSNIRGMLLSPFRSKKFSDWCPVCPYQRWVRFQSLAKSKTRLMSRWTNKLRSRKLVSLTENNKFKRHFFRGTECKHSS